MTVVGVIPHSRYIFNPILILCIQHWFVLLAYASKPLYAAVQLVLEYMFEWIVLSDAAQIYHLHWTAGWAGCAMLVAHWMYLIAGVLETVAGDSTHQSSSTDIMEEENVHQRGTKIWLSKSRELSPSPEGGQEGLEGINASVHVRFPDDSTTRRNSSKRVSAPAPLRSSLRSSLRSFSSFKRDECAPDLEQAFASTRSAVSSSQQIFGQSSLRSSLQKSPRPIASHRFVEYEPDLEHSHRSLGFESTRSARSVFSYHSTRRNQPQFMLKANELFQELSFGRCLHTADGQSMIDRASSPVRKYPEDLVADNNDLGNPPFSPAIRRNPPDEASSLKAQKLLEKLSFDGCLEED